MKPLDEEIDRPLAEWKVFDELKLPFVNASRSKYEKTIDDDKFDNCVTKRSR